MTPTLAPFGDRAVLVDWHASGYDEPVSQAALGLAENLRDMGAFVEIVPGYSSVMVEFDPLALSLEEAERQVRKALSRAKPLGQGGELVELPVKYGGSDGPDLERIANNASLSTDEVIARHCAQTYRVCMMGFIPGFAFLSEVPPELAHPRHKTPRQTVPAGSVGIAGWQTGIYGLSSPGGWQIIGRTEARIFSADRDPAFLIRPGDRIRFVPQ